MHDVTVARLVDMGATDEEAADVLACVNAELRAALMKALEIQTHPILVKL